MRAPLDDVVSMALFAEVVRQGSFSEAARQSGLAKSAISKRISQLEARLGVRLLTRSTRRLSLTEDGVRYYEHCRALVDAADAAEDALAGASTEPRGALRLNAPVTFAQMFLTAAVSGFLQQYPDIEIQLHTDDRLVDLIEGGFDLVIRITRATLDDSSLIAKRLSPDRLVVCGAPSYFAAHGRPSSPAELVEHNCLHYTMVGRAGEWRFRGATGPVSVPTRGSFSSSDGTVLRQAALSGLGLVVLPWFMVARDVSERRLELVLEGTRRAEIGIFALLASRKQLPLRTKLLLDHLVRYFGAPDWRLRAAPSTFREERSV